MRFVVLLVAALAIAAPAHAYRDCSSLPPGFWYRPAPSALGGVYLPDRGPEAAATLARTLGLGTVSCARQPNGWWMEGARLGATALIWQSRGGEAPILGLACRGAQPILRPMTDWGCPWLNPMLADQPAGALRVTRVTALVPDVDAYCEQATWRDGRMTRSVPFGAAFLVPEYGARARELTLENGALRVMEPVEPDGLADRWLRSLGPGWFGFAVEVADGIAARAVLERRGIHVLAPRRRGATLLVVDPDQTGGTLVEYVTSTMLP